jgi:hypothetical protein
MTQEWTARLDLDVSLGVQERFASENFVELS